MNLNVLGIDLAKSVFQLHGNDAKGRVVLRKQLRRSQLKLFIANLPVCTIAMEACSGAHHWARTFREMGHTVSLIAPQHVKPFVKTNKTDSADAEAIAEAAVRPNMRFVTIKEHWQQELLALHRTRQLYIRQKVALSNATRGFLAEKGIVFPAGTFNLKKGLKELLGQEQTNFSGMFEQLILQLRQQIDHLQHLIDDLEEQIVRIGRTDERCKRLQKIEGVGPMISTAVVATIGSAEGFSSSRQFAAFFGLVPRQHSSGSKHQLLGISKRGDKYIRALLIHGARAVIQHADKRDTSRSRWALKKVETRGMNKATVAVANKTARVIWALLKRNEEYRSAA